MKSAVQLPKSIMKPEPFLLSFGDRTHDSGTRTKRLQKRRKEKCPSCSPLTHSPAAACREEQGRLGSGRGWRGSCWTRLLSSSPPLSLHPPPTSSLRQKQTWTMNVRRSPMSNHSISSLHHPDMFPSLTPRHSFTLLPSLKPLHSLTLFSALLLIRYSRHTHITLSLRKISKNQRRNPYENNINARQEIPEFAKNWLPA